MATVPDFEGCQIVDKLRSGPVADVYQAIQQPLGRPVLIKALIPSILPSSPFAATLEREARLLAELHHPNILHVHDYVRKDERMWLVLEYVDGWTLDELLGLSKRLPVPAAAGIALELSRALDHAHAKGIVHRDVQPKNVLVSRQGQVKLMSFSVAVDERMPTAPELLDGGTSFAGPAYMSPEQILGEPADPRSDLFSLGVVLYEMLSGDLPFRAPDERTVTQLIRHEPAPPLSRVAVVPGSLERIVQRCLEKMPGDRFQSAAELALALEDFMREFGGGSAQRIIGGALAAAGLVDEAPRSLGEIPPPIASIPPRASLGPALGGLITCFFLILGGGGVIQYLAWRTGGGSPARGTTSRLELAPTRAGYLRVVADPWAYVIVDGERVETTPFARAIPLSAGTHYVRLEHPNAPTERRTIVLAAGETILLDVKMKVTTASTDAAGVELVAPTEAGNDAHATP